LQEALDEFKGPIAYLDFETIGLPIPVWHGCRPYAHVPVQFSCEVENARGTFDHHEWLAAGPNDPRKPLATALIASLRGAATIVAYNASFERDRILELADALPQLAAELTSIAHRLRDLLPIVREHVYHPAFRGSFSLKRVLPALVPSLQHSDLEISDGGLATTVLERLLFAADGMSEAERAKLRTALLAYCRLDTWGLVKIVEQLREIRATA
jgi:hypothetical protein